MSAFPEIDRLKAEWDALQPIPAEASRKLWQKLRLEWNYHSNHIEGNTLTYGETELLLLHGQTHGVHTLREFEEMKAHDVGISHVRTLAEDARNIGEGDIRDLNRIILKEPFWKEARTAEGRPSRKEIVPGDYKTTPNNVLTATGEMFYFAAPDEVSAKMQELVAWIGSSLAGSGSHIVEIAAKLHHDFVLIHPFDDGNGRVARMLVNYLFLKSGYPPIIVPTEEKARYLAALRLADAGDLRELVEYLAGRLEHSLRLAIRAGEGESIQEPSDVEKEVALFVRGQNLSNLEESLPDKALFTSLKESSFIPLIQSLEAKLKMFLPLFSRHSIHTENEKNAVGGESSNLDLVRASDPGGHVRVAFSFIGYKGDASVPYDEYEHIKFNSLPGKYTLEASERPILSRTYDKPLLAEEVDSITAQILSEVLRRIRTRTGDSP